MMDGADLRAWLGKSRARDETRAPIVVVRVRSGGAPAATRFCDQQTANALAAERAGAWLEPAYLRIERPVLETPDEGLVDLEMLAGAVGEQPMRRVAAKFAADIEATGSFEPFRDRYVSVAEMSARASEGELATLQMPAPLLFADAEELEILRAAGFDGAIYGGNGEQHWVVFDEKQVRPAIAAGWPRRASWQAAQQPARRPDPEQRIQAVRQAVLKITGSAPADEAIGRMIVTTSGTIQQRLQGTSGSSATSLAAHPAVSPALKALARERQERRARALAAVGNLDDCIILRKPGAARWMMILRDASSSGRWRLQSFDEDGLDSHATVADRARALREAADAGYTQRDDLALDRLQDTPRFQRGLLQAELSGQRNRGEISLAQFVARLEEFDRLEAVLSSVGRQMEQACCDVRTGSIFLLADRIAEGHEQAVVFHEIAHKYGRSTLGYAGWRRLVSGIRGWRTAPAGSSENVIYMAADARARAATGGDRLLYEEELFAYGVEEAVLRGHKPSALAHEGSVERWLDDVECTLRGVLMQLTAQPPRALTGQQLVDVAYALAQLENPARAALLAERLGPSFEKAVREADAAAKAALAARRASPRPLRMSTRAVDEAFARMVDGAKDALGGVLVNWCDAELDGRQVQIVRRATEREGAGAKQIVGKREFLEWLTRDGSLAPRARGDGVPADAEWRAQIERLRAFVRPEPPTLRPPGPAQSGGFPSATAVALQKSLRPVSQATKTLLRKRGEGVASALDAQRRFDAGERLFVFHEQADEPSEARSVLDLEGFTPDQIMALPFPQAEAATQSPGFKRWFGDWEDRHAHTSRYPSGKTPVSQAVSVDGSPRVMYHATNADIAVFETGRPTSNSTTFGPVETVRHAIFVAPEVQFAHEHLRGSDGGNVLPVYIDVKAPADLREGVPGEIIAEIVARTSLRHADFYHLKATDTWQLFDGEFGEQVVRALKDAGYDGAILTELSRDRCSEHEVWAAFEPTQLKSAISNSGQFDAADPDIRHSRQPFDLDQAQAESVRWSAIAAELERKYDLDVDLRFMHTINAVRLEWIAVRNAKAQGGGAGTDALHEIVRAADVAGLTLTLSVAAADEERLRRWYASFGFEQTSSQGMRREPGAPVTRPLWKGAAFKKWFGASAVANRATGQPLVAYHGTTDLSGFDAGAFSFNAKGVNGYGDADLGFFFASSAAVASAFASEPEGGGIVPVHLSIQRPLIISWQDWEHRLDTWKIDDWQRFGREARAAGHDGIQITTGPGAEQSSYRPQFDSDNWVVFRPEQIKSAIGNDGAFAPHSADLRHSVPAQTLGAAPVRLSAAVLATADSPTFREWFEDSVVVDAAGWPLPVFHGTTRTFGRFSTARLGEKTGAWDAKAGFFFAENPDAAAQFTWEAGEPYGGNLMPVFLRLTNPLIVTELMLDGSTGTRAGLIMRRAQAQGHDGVIFEKSDMLGRTGRAFAVFSPDQIKSATGNRGTWSRRQSDIRLSVPAARHRIPEAFQQWLDGSHVVEADGSPRVVYRGEHGETETGELQTQLGTYTFSSPEVASVYAVSPNSHSVAAAPRVIPAYLAIRNPVFDLRDDPFVELSEVERKLGRDVAEQAVIRAGLRGVVNTSNWEENFAALYGSDVERFLREEPAALSQVYMDAYVLLDDPEFVAAARAGGYDGAIHLGNGESALELEYRVFDREQIRSVFDGDLRASVPLSAAGRRPTWWRAPANEEFRAWFAGSTVRHPVFHTTSADFAEFDATRGDLGAHFGTLEQALHVADRGPRSAQDGRRVVPVWLKLQNPLRLRDEGSFHADGIAVQLERKGLLPAGEGKRIRQACDTDFRLREKFDAKLRAVIRAAGYDGVVYRNEHEGQGDSYIVFEPGQVRTALDSATALRNSVCATAGPRPTAWPTEILAAHAYPERGRDHPVRSTAHGIKDGDEQALEQAAAEMAALVPAGAVLVPVPGGDGGTARALALAGRIGRYSGSPVADILVGVPRASQYAAKKAAIPLAAEQMPMRLRKGCSVPPGALLVDNVAGTGETLRAARLALRRNVPALVYAAESSLQEICRLRIGAQPPPRPAPATTGGPDDPYDFSADPAFHHLFYGQPQPQDMADFARWLRERPNAFVRLFHGTAAANPVLQQGLLPTTARRRNSYQSTSGFVCASVYPGHARQFGAMAALNRGGDEGGFRVAVYPVVLTVRRLCADLDQLRNVRMGGIDCGNSLAESLVRGHGARVRGVIEPGALRRPHLYRTVTHQGEGESPASGAPARERQPA